MKKEEEKALAIINRLYRYKNNTFISCFRFAKIFGNIVNEISSISQMNRKFL